MKNLHTHAGLNVTHTVGFTLHHNAVPVYKGRTSGNIQPCSSTFPRNRRTAGSNSFNKLKR